MATANGSGKLLQAVCSDIMTRLGIGHTDEFRRDSVRGVLGRKLRADFWLPVVPGYETSSGIYLQCKRQWSNGSADSKCVELLMDIKECYDKPTLVILDGPKLSDVKAMFADHAGGKILSPCDISEFIRFCESISPLSEDEAVEQLRVTAFDPRQQRMWT